MTVLTALVFVTMGFLNKSVGQQWGSFTLLIVAASVVGGLGFLMLTKKSVREGTLGTVLFVIFALSLATAVACLFFNFENGQLVMTLFVSKVVAIGCAYMGTKRTKKIANLKKNMVVAFIMAILLVIAGVVISENRTKGTGVVGGATTLALAMGAVALTCFYVTFALLVIQVPEATSDGSLDDVYHYSVRIYVDVVYSVFLILSMLWQKVWG